MTYNKLWASAFLAAVVFSFPSAAAENGVTVNYEALDGIDVNYDALDEISPIADDFNQKIILKNPALPQNKNFISSKNKVVKNKTAKTKTKAKIKAKAQTKKQTATPVKKANAVKKPVSIKTSTPITDAGKVHKETEKEAKKILTPISSNETLINPISADSGNDARKNAQPTSIKIIREVQVSTVNKEGEASIVKDMVEEEIPLKEKPQVINNKYLVLNFPPSVVHLTEDDNRRLNLFFSKYDGKSRIKIVSYATGLRGSVESAKRNSLKRALAVRSALIKFGMKSNLIEVRAQGKASDPDKADAVEITVY